MKLALIAHGSDRDPHAAAGVIELAQKIGAQCYFLRQSPSLNDLTQNHLPVLAIPLLAGHGYFADHVIPKILKGHDHVRVTPPLGVYAKTADYLARQIEQICPSDDISVLLIAHGSHSRPAAAAKKSADQLAQSLAGRFAHVMALFLEEPPYASDWQSYARHDRVILVPLTFISGLHGGTDIPALTSDISQVLNPNAPKVFVTKGLMADTEMAGLILDYAAEFGHTPRIG